MKLRTQLYLAVAAISTALLLSLLYGNQLLMRLDSVRQAQMSVSELETAILQMWHYEKDFLTDHNLQHVARVGQMHRRAQAALEQLLKVGDGIVLGDDLNVINDALEKYQRSFILLSVQIDTIGLTQSSGLLRQLDNRAGQLEKILDNTYHVQRDFLVLRQHEKNFIHHKELKYSQLLQDQAAHITADLSAAGHAENSPEIQAVRQYVKHFLDIVTASKAIGLSEDEGQYGKTLDAAKALETRVSKFHEKARYLARHRLNDIYRQLALVFGLLLIGIATGLMVMARHISFKASRVSEVMVLVQKTHNLESRLPTNGKDEFAIISRSFNAMMELINKASVERDKALRKARKTLRENASLLRKMEALKFAIDQHSIVSFTDPKGVITYVNDKFCEISQYPKQALLGQPHRIVNSGHHPKEFFQEMWQTIQTGQVWKGDICNRKKDGTPYWVDATIIPFLNEKGEPEQYAAIRTNITQLHDFQETLLREKAEQKALIDQLEQAQGQLIQSEKLASLGQLSAGVAHEINNPVGYISSNISTLSGYAESLLSVIEVYQAAEPDITRPEADTARIDAACQAADIEFLRDDVTDLLSECREGIDRVRKIVRDLKEFSHPDDGEWQQADLHKGIDSTLNIVHNEIKYNATVVKHYGTLPNVTCIPSQINQVFMNLLVNAAHAIDGQGTITLTSGTDGNDVWVSITDTGKGIEPEHLKKLFDPFFTTKAVGEGTGLGLSLSYGIIQKHHGNIEVNSTLGEGTTFIVTIPIDRARQSPLQEAC